MNILVVDDNPTTVMLIREILRKAGYVKVTISEACNNSVLYAYGQESGTEDRMKKSVQAIFEDKQ